MIAFVVWSVVCCVFLVISYSSYRAKEPIVFFQGVEPPKIKPENVSKYNRAVAKIWLFFAITMEIMGIPILFCEQNSPVFVLVTIGVVFLIIGIMVMYLTVKNKYESR